MSAMLESVIGAGYASSGFCDKVKNAIHPRASKIPAYSGASAGHSDFFT
jgi:hypothetical protein